MRPFTESTTRQDIEKLLAVTFKKHKYDFAKDLLIKILDKKYEENNGNWKHSPMWYVTKVAKQVIGVDARQLHSMVNLRKYKFGK